MSGPEKQPAERDATTMKSIETMTEEIRALAPWHHDIPLTADFSTGKAFSADGSLKRHENQNVALLSSLTHSFQTIAKTIYPNGMHGKRVLDCACNAGIYCFLARELGAEFAFGFDVREHWIQQANWVKEHRTIAPTDRIRFAVCDLYDLGKRNLPQFDLTVFKGIFYHLPDPISGLRLASELTKEVLVFNTQATWGQPDGFLCPGMEDVTSLMSGAYGLNWRPTGPRTMIPVLKWLGYVQAKLHFYVPSPGNPGLGRMELYATKVQGRLDGFADLEELYRV
jgi:SAM-dependent methyltransferase